MVSAGSSSAGKTTVTVALLSALAARGLDVAALKSGPDYLDPLFHERVCGHPARNLDLFMLGAAGARRLLARSVPAQGVAVIEGAMGLYDGVAGSDECSSWHLAALTRTPVVLVVDGRGRALSAAAEVLGHQRLRDPSMIAAVIVNRCTAGFFPTLKELIERECGVPVAGFLPALPEAALPARHLGLVSPDEVEGLAARVRALGEAAARTIDLDLLLGIARAAGPVPPSDCAPARADRGVAGEAPEPERASGSPEPARPGPEGVANGEGSGAGAVVAVARDDAFCFYYADALEELERQGCRPAFFSPLADEGLPAGASGLYLGGGYPELHARRLAANASMLDAVRAAATRGMPLIAECGGFLYLHRRLQDAEGAWHELAGVVDGSAWRRTRKSARFGYVRLHASADSLLFRVGEPVPAHEFHYWESDCAGGDLVARKPRSERSWPCGHADRVGYMGFPHLNLAGDVRLARRFAAACAAFARGGSERLR
ncbi:cobyrinate a,c-diamide synthase [Eggerthellaceae bacterium zg-997]|nr:cobyrinate a,c-diamide synthase [Eggerthellaceae bacterium zg-997]